MKIYITGHFATGQNQAKIEGLAAAVRAAHMKDFCFVRDVEHYRYTFETPKEKWLKIYDEIGACDALLIDISDASNGSRAIECGIAFALKKPIIVVLKRGTEYKQLFDDIASTVVEYDEYKDITKSLRKYEKERDFGVTDKIMLFTVLVLFGIGSAWGLAQYFLPLGLVGPIVYWLIVRQIIPTMRIFDRIIIYLPLAVIWLGGMAFLYPFYAPLAWAWTLVYWFGVLIILQRLKFSL